MSTTTIRLPEDLKARVAAAAERAGTTAHSFILEAIAEKADQAERRADFHDVAEERCADLLASGKTIPWIQSSNLPNCSRCSPQSPINLISRTTALEKTGRLVWAPAPFRHRKTAASTAAGWIATLPSPRYRQQ